MTPFLKSFFFGLAIAIPPGPIGILSIRKTIELGFLGALCVALGVAVADSIYSIIAIAGLTALSSFFEAYVGYIQLIGGLLLIILGIRELLNPPVEHSRKVPRNSTYVKLILESVAFTLANPATIIIFMSFFASIGANTASLAGKGAMVFGVFCGSCLWFIILGLITLQIRGYISKKWMNQIHILSATILMGFGLWAFIHGYNNLQCPTRPVCAEPVLISTRHVIASDEPVILA